MPSVPQRVSPAFVTPMAAQVVKKLPEGDDWTYELKFDGYRALLLKDGRTTSMTVPSTTCRTRSRRARAAA